MLKKLSRFPGIAFTKIYKNKKYGFRKSSGCPLVHASVKRCHSC